MCGFPIVITNTNNHINNDEQYHQQQCGLHVPDVNHQNIQYPLSYQLSMILLINIYLSGMTALGLRIES